MQGFIAIGFAVLMAAPAAGAPKEPPPPPPPIVTYWPAPVRTPARFGNWFTADWGDYTEAHTLNDSGSAFGVLCGKVCVFYVDLQAGCNAGEEYPATLNGPDGVHRIRIKCYHDDSLSVFTFKIAPALVDMVMKGGEVEFTIPSKDGHVTAPYFSLDGGFRALMNADSLAQEKRERSQPGLRDFTD